MDRLSVHVSVDGLPLHKSSSTQVWPILRKLEQIPEAPVMMVAMFCGTSKPNDLEPFLRPFVLEANELSQRGLRFGDKIVCFNIRAIIADSPARAFLKATTNFNGLHGCLKCTCVGEFLKRERKVIFDSVGANSRTDAGFRSRECPDHHQRWRTPLEDLFSGKLPLHCS
uniref:Uncharacterized protein n=1 Tax=Anopheles atroparvus TaxID=41427 RepID=A0AAG5D155_ANOAO